MTNERNIIAGLFKEHYRNLVGYARQRTPGYCNAHAEDAVQETFLHAYDHLRAGKSIDKPKGFLIMTLQNVIVSRLYRGHINTHVNGVEDVDIFDSSSNERPDKQADCRQRLQVFQDAIDAIPNAMQRAAFVRRRIYQESCKEIGEALLLTESAVSNYAAFGWKHVQQYIEERGFSITDFFEDAA